VSAGAAGSVGRGRHADCGQAAPPCIQTDAARPTGHHENARPHGQHRRQAWPAAVAGRHRVRLRLIVNTVNHQLALGTGGIGTPAGKIQTLGVGRYELLERQHARRLADNDIEGVVDPRQAAVLRLRAGDDEDV
jgi:hypothetical protein